jgi:hypothetical protein
MLLQPPLHDMTMGGASAAALLSPLQVGRMYDSLIRSTINKNYMAPWEPQEDLLLLRAVRSHGTNWGDIEALGVVPGRTARQMRVRFATTLDPDIDHSPLNAEVSVLLNCVTWAFMAFGLTRQMGACFATTLDPDIDHSPLSAEVRATLCRSVGM